MSKYIKNTFIHLLLNFKGLLFIGLLCLNTTSSGIVIHNPAFINAIEEGDDGYDALSIVAKVCDESGNNVSGSATFIKGKFLLTANSVENRSHVTFDDITFYARDMEFEPRQIVVNGQNVDLKVIKLLEEPTFPNADLEVLLYSDSGNNSEVIGGFTTPDVIVAGWGVGNDRNHDPGFGFTRSWAWADIESVEKRYGYNQVKSIEILTDGTYNYEALVTELNPNFTEGAIAHLDEGGGIFKKFNNEWHLIGIATHYTQLFDNNFSYFDFPPPFFTSIPPDLNYFVRISAYIDEIEAAMIDSSTYLGWQLEQGLSGDDTLGTADTDGDGISQLLEFALGGNPLQSDVEVYPKSELTTDGDKSFLNIILARPQGLQGVTYTPEVSTDLLNWAEPDAFDPVIPVVIEGPTDKTNGIEEVIYRFEIDDKMIFARLRVSISS